MAWDGPVLDNHLHLGDDRDRAMDAVSDFVGAGGTHLIVINKPSWWFGVAVDGREDFRIGFERTIETVRAISPHLPGRAWPLLGVHPALISRLIDDRGLSIDRAAELMTAGLAVAAEYVAAGDAIGLKSGRPHYPVDDDVREASNQVMRSAFSLAAEHDCAVQLHTEGGDDFSDVAIWAEEAGLEPHRVVKHYADGPITGPTPSVIARPDALERAVEQGDPFLMETDYLDDPERPGAVLGPKTVPRRVRWLAEEGHEEAIRRAHIDTPNRIYDLDMNADS